MYAAVFVVLSDAMLGFLRQHFMFAMLNPTRYMLHVTCYMFIYMACVYRRPSLWVSYRMVFFAFDEFCVFTCCVSRKHSQIMDAGTNVALSSPMDKIGLHFFVANTGVPCLAK